MFEGPEYASYIELCRELRLERKPKLAGEWFLDPKDQPMVPKCSCVMLPDNEWASRLIWLPRLDQWLAMLEEAGSPSVGFTRVVQYPSGVRFVVLDSTHTYLDAITTPNGATREEAAARLWMAVGKR